MEADSRGSRAEELLGHRGWVLKLAERLLADPQAADDFSLPVAPSGTGSLERSVLP